MKSLRQRVAPFQLFIWALGAGWLCGIPTGWAQSQPSENKTQVPEDEDSSSSPFTDYGSFQEDKEEEKDTFYFQNGRFFGVSVGLGYQGVAGNRGRLYRGGYPLVDFKVHYWFDFNFALDLGIFYVSHYYSDPNLGGNVDVNLFHGSLHLKYYFDTRDFSAPISFANPYLLAGIGSATQSKSSALLTDEIKIDPALGISGGAGLEFTLIPKKTYLAFEAKYHWITFADTQTQDFQKALNIPDLTGGFYTLQMSVLLTW